MTTNLADHHHHDGDDDDDNHEDLAENGHSRLSELELKPIVNSIGEVGSSYAAPQTSTKVQGRWRDSLLDICRFGPFHATVCHGCCCPVLGAGQVASRLHLDAWGRRPSTTTAAAKVFARLLVLTLGYWISRVIIFIIIAVLDPNVEADEYTEPPPAYYFWVFTDDMVYFCFWVFLVVLLRNIRMNLRAHYLIPESDACPAGLEDTCLSVCCPCLVVAQMMRHTADYQTYAGRCCTSTGLGPHVPDAV